jgi:hypothetical protein
MYFALLEACVVAVFYMTSPARHTDLMTVLMVGRQIVGLQASI